jgi:hypothetical protein
MLRCALLNRVSLMIDQIQQSGQNRIAGMEIFWKHNQDSSEFGGGIRLEV